MTDRPGARFHRRGPGRWRRELTPGLRSRIEAIVGEGRVSDRHHHLRAYAHDAWPRTTLQLREGIDLKPPWLVVWPERVEALAALARLASEERIPLVPYGAGSGVCGGVYPVRGGIAVSLERFDTVGRVDPLDRLVRVGAGVIGQHLEDALARQGYTAGHVPSSIHCSSVGGWVAGRGAGQCSSRYGKIEDIVAGLTLVDGLGEIHRFEPRPSLGLGPSLLHLVVGSEGVLGFIPEVVLRVRRAPRVRRMRGILLPSVAAGVEALRRIFGAGLRPFVARLYDPLDTLVNKGKGTATASPGRGVRFLHRVQRAAGTPHLVRRILDGLAGAGLARPALLNRLVDRLGTRALLVLGSEGADATLVEHELAQCLALCAETGGQDLGPGPGEHWLAHRHAVSYKLSPLLAMGAFVDTMEVATTWEGLLPLYHAVRLAVARHAFVMAHFSHAYEDGASIYFTFAGWAPNLSERVTTYDTVWRLALEAAVEAGAAISHHHGIGLGKGAQMPAALGEGGMRLLWALKEACDPAHVCNPEKLGLVARDPNDGGTAPLEDEVTS